MSFLVFNIFLVILLILSILAYCLTTKIEHLEIDIEEQQSLINASRRSLKNAERQIEDRNKVIEYQENKYKAIKNYSNVLENCITSNNYGSTEIQIRKLKELVNDNHATNQFKI